VTTDETVDHKKVSIQTSLLTSFITVALSLIIFVFGFQPLANIDQNKQNIEDVQLQLDELKAIVTVSREQLELQVRDYIDKNYGELSERDEKVDKLIIYFRQQDARLSNIEEALSKF